MSENVDFTNPPLLRPYFHMSAEKIDEAYQRNALLLFIESKGLTEECLK